MSSAGLLRTRRGYFAVSLGVLVLDQLTKLLAHQTLSDRVPVDIVPNFFRLWYSRNPGGLFGSFRDWSGPWRFVLLTLLPTAAQHVGPSRRRRGDILQDGECFEGANPMSAVGV